MEVTQILVEKLAGLAKLNFSEEEMEEIRQDLSQMISFVDQLQALDLSGVPPLTHMADTADRRRDDKPLPIALPEEALANAPSVQGPYFTVPTFIHK